MACEAEVVICVRTDARGKSAPTEHDVSTARWLRKLFEVLDVPLRDYIVVGKGMVSLRDRGIIGRS
jgi:DNA repair protein RadC